MHLTTDMQRARARAMGLGFRTVTQLIATHMGLSNDNQAVRSVRNRISKGLETRRTMRAYAEIFKVPSSYWIEDDAARVRAMAIAPPPTEENST